MESAAWNDIGELWITDLSLWIFWGSLWMAFSMKSMTYIKIELESTGFLRSVWRIQGKLVLPYCTGLSRWPSQKT